MTRLLVLSASILAVLVTNSAQARAEAPEVALEISPLATVFRGAGVGSRLRLPAAPKLALGAGAYTFTLPTLFVDQIAGNADEGWNVAIRPAGYVSADYFLDRQGQGVSFGLAVVLARFALSSDEVSGATAYTSLYAVPRVGYTWSVWRGLYVAPSVGIELHRQLGGGTQIADRSFEPVGIQPSVGLQVGYVFSGGPQR
jgi:hypothetical protein